MIHIKQSGFDEDGIWCCEGEVMGIPFFGELPDGRHFQWGTTPYVPFPQEVLNELVKALQERYFKDTTPEDVAEIMEDVKRRAEGEAQ
jgi:hypothetical protein